VFWEENNLYFSTCIYLITSFQTRKSNFNITKDQAHQFPFFTCNAESTFGKSCFQMTTESVSLSHSSGTLQ